MDLDQKLEAVLFYKAEPIAINKLAKILEVTEEQVLQAVDVLREKLSTRGLVLISHDGALALGTSPDASSLIENIVKEELSKDLGKAGLETLTIVLYRGPISRPEIDYIRGVNSSFILRNLMIRGLVEKNPSPTDSRSYLYQPSLELLTTLGITDIADLPDYDQIKDEILNFITEKEKLSA